MTTTVEIGRVRGFILDDPVAGVLDNTDYRLGGLDFVDVTSYVRDLSLRRGKNRDLDRFSAGSLSVTLNNQTRYFDPFVAPDIDPIPRIPIRMKYNGAVQYYGIVDDWNFAYDPGGISYAQVQATDELTKLARQTVLPTGSAVEQFTGERVANVLDQSTVDWPADKRDIDTGNTNLLASNFAGENALEYLQLIETSEQGQLFIGKDGDLVFRSHADSTPTTAGLVTFADDGTGINYKQVFVNYGTELMVNRATVETPANTESSDNSRSQTVYGVIAEEIKTLEIGSARAQELADYLVSKYADPEYRFEQILFDITSLPGGDVSTVMGLNIGDVVLVKFTPNDIGAAIEQYAQIIGIAHEVTSDTHDVILRLASLTYTSLVLDDPEFGKLDLYSLGF
jgi:hypothetical protein